MFEFWIIMGILAQLVIVVFLNHLIASHVANKFSDKYLDAVFEQAEDIRAEVRAEVLRKQVELEELTEKALDDQRLVLDQQFALAKDKFTQISSYFKESLDKDVTQRVLSAAYHVVSLNLPSRDSADASLAEAVIAHEREGAPYMDAETKGKHNVGGGMLN
jgi:hypothetical protein